MFLDTPQGAKLALKATGWMTNCKPILDNLAKLCSNTGGPNDHDHANLQYCWASRAAVYPVKSWYALSEGIRKQLVSDNVMFEGGHR